MKAADNHIETWESRLSPGSIFIAQYSAYGDTQNSLQLIMNVSYNRTKPLTNCMEGRAVAYVISCSFFTSKARVCVRVSPCRICSGQSGTRTVFSHSSSVLL
jgi:hypothetical protein